MSPKEGDIFVLIQKNPNIHTIKISSNEGLNFGLSIFYQNKKSP
jgi:hypothetical protein